MIDALVYKLRKESLLYTNRPFFLTTVFLSALFWWIFEFLNLGTTNWEYAGLAFANITLRNLYGTLAFATVLPAFFETVELFRAIHLFDHVRLKKHHRITRRFLHGMIAVGIISFILPLLFPQHFYPLVWITFFFLLDPLNYLHKQPSIIQHLKDGRLRVPLSLLAAGILLGFLWEFWNYWAVPKWTYDIPFVGFFKVFEMPLLGYIGYFPFAFELYAMFFFVRSLFTRSEPMLTR